MTPITHTQPRPFPRLVKPAPERKAEPVPLAANVTPEAKRAFLALKAEFDRLAPAFGTYTTPAVQARAQGQAFEVSAAALRLWEALS